MPEGDTLFRTAAGLRPHLVGPGRDARRGPRVPGPQVERIVGATVDAVDAVGKNLLDPLRQRPGAADAPADARLVAPLPAAASRWRRPGRPGASSCSRCRAPSPSASTPRWSSCSRPRAEELHPPLGGPRAGRDRRRLRPRRGAPPAARSARAPGCTVAEALLDQRALAGHRQRLQERGRSSSSASTRSRRVARPGRRRRSAGSSTGPGRCSLGEPGAGRCA